MDILELELPNQNKHQLNRKIVSLKDKKRFKLLSFNLNYRNCGGYIKAVIDRNRGILLYVKKREQILEIYDRKKYKIKLEDNILKNKIGVFLDKEFIQERITPLLSTETKEQLKLLLLDNPIIGFIPKSAEPFCNLQANFYKDCYIKNIYNTQKDIIQIRVVLEYEAIDPQDLDIFKEMVDFIK